VSLFPLRTSRPINARRTGDNAGADILFIFLIFSGVRYFRRIFFLLTFSCSYENGVLRTPPPPDFAELLFFIIIFYFLGDDSPQLLDGHQDEKVQ
jgi:hypothetical protein